MVPKGGIELKGIGVIKTTTYESEGADILPHSAPYTYPISVICKGEDWGWKISTIGVAEVLPEFQT